MLKILKRSIEDEIKELFGFPSAVNRVILNNPNISRDYKIPPKTAGINNNHKWSTQIGYISSTSSRFIFNNNNNYSFDFREFGDGESDRSWVVEAHNKYDLRELVISEKEQNFICDIKNVEGLYASKSNLDNYKDLDDFALNGTYKFLEDISKNNFYKLLEHSEIRIIHTPDADCFIIDEWDGRLFLANSGGSHHFAAARYIANKLDINYELKGSLKKYSYNKNFLSNLIDDFEIFTINYNEIFGDFYKALREYKASFALMPFPGQVEGQFLILLPKTIKKSKQVATLLDKAKYNNFYNHLKNIIEENHLH